MIEFPINIGYSYWIFYVLWSPTTSTGVREVADSKHVIPEAHVR